MNERDRIAKIFSEYYGVDANRYEVADEILAALRPEKPAEKKIEPFEIFSHPQRYGSFDCVIDEIKLKINEIVRHLNKRED